MIDLKPARLKAYWLPAALLLAASAASTAAAACLESAGTWKNAALAAQTGVFTVEFDATPGAARMDGVAGLSDGAASGYAALAAAVRFNAAGAIDARNGGAYAASAAVPYSAGIAYHFRLEVDLVSRTYSAWVAPAGGAETRIAAAYAFRTEQRSVARLDNLALLASTGSESACGASAVAAAPADAAPLCLVSAGSWRNAALPAQAGRFTVEFDATPGAARMDGVAGLSAGAASGYNALAAAVRFNAAGRIDARNGGSYAAAAAIPYSAGLAYHFRLDVDLAAHVYSAWVRQGASPEQLLGSGLAFRSEQKNATKLDNLALLAATGSESACGPTAIAAASSAAAAPAVSAVSAAVLGQSSATVSWTTGEAADGQVEYGLTTSYGSFSVLDAALKTSHAAALGGLAAATPYHYRVRSRDAAGNLAVSPDSTFTTAAAAPPATAATFTEDFSSYPTGVCLADGAAFGPWTSLFNGYGCNAVRTDGSSFWLEESPFPSASPSETHASMVLGPSFAAPFTLSAGMRTDAQLRTGSAPNAWEVAWLVWNYADNVHFYYFTLKPNGWELGKADPAYPGAQRFLATGSTPVFPIGTTRAVKIVQADDVIEAYADGTLLARFTDDERPYRSGRIGLYNEDSRVRFSDVAVNAGSPAAAAAPAAAYPAALEARAPQKILSPALRDGINDAAEFGTEAAEVDIYDLKGRAVFRAAKQGAAPIVWDGRDGSGRVRESGVYVARIKKADSGVLYQSFVLVK